MFSLFKIPIALRTWMCNTPSVNIWWFNSMSTMPHHFFKALLIFLTCTEYFMNRYWLFALSENFGWVHPVKQTKMGIRNKLWLSNSGLNHLYRETSRHKILKYVVNWMSFKCKSTHIPHQLTMTFSISLTIPALRYST